MILQPHAGADLVAATVSSNANDDEQPTEKLCAPRG